MDVLFRQVAHVGERQAREGAEQVEVAVKLLLGVFQPALHQQPDFLFRQETACGFLFLISYSRNGSRVSHSLLMAMNTIVRKGQTYSHTVLVQQCLSVRRNISKSEMKAGVSFFQCNILHAVADGEELLQVLVNGPVLQERAFGFHAGLHLFLVVLVVLAEHLHQRVVAVFQSEKGVLDLLRRDKVVTLHDFLIVFVDTHTHLVEHAVRFECRRASARDTSPFGVHSWDRRSALAELRLAAVHRDASHDGYCPVLFHYLTLEVVDY